MIKDFLRVKLICIFTLYLFIFSNFKAIAQDQERKVQGKVVNEYGMPISGATILLDGNLVGTITDEKGSFLLKLTPGRHRLTVNHLGYQSVEKQFQLLDVPIILSIKLLASENLMEEVTITGLKSQSAVATRTLLPILNIPQAITIVGQKTIREQASIDLAAISKNIVGLNFTGNYSGAGSSQFFNARGFDLNDSQNYRLNGVMVWNWGNQYTDNIEQVEFLKGPTSILFGDVAPGGVMNLVTKKPLTNFMAAVDFKTGSWGLFRPSVDLTGPITKNKTLRYRVNTSYERSGSFRDQVSGERRFIAPALAWDISPKLALTVEGIFKESSATDDAGLVSPNGSINGLQSLDPSLYLGEPSRKYLYNDQSYFSTLTYEINPTWRVKMIGFHGITKNRPFGLWFDQPDADGDYIRREYGYYQKAKNNTLALDVYGAFYTRSIKHHVLVGVEYQSTSYRQTNGGELTILDENNIYAPVYGKSVVTEPLKVPFRPYITSLNRMGLHIQDQLMFFEEKLHVLLGLRIGRTRQGNSYIEDEQLGTPYEGYLDDMVSKNVFTPRVGLVYKFQNHSLYASYAKGYEINSPDLFAQNYLDYASPPATLSSQVEFGIKMKLLSNKLGLSLSAYEINKRNPYGYVYLDPINPNYDEYEVYYDGKHQSRGLELEVDGEIVSGLSLNGGFGYTNAKVIEDPGYPSRNVLPNAPKFSANGWINFGPKSLKGFNLSTGVFYKSSFFSSLKNDPNLEIPTSYTWDAAIAYEYKQFGIQLNAMNITNQISYLNPWQFNLFDVRPLRQFMVTLRYRIDS